MSGWRPALRIARRSIRRSRGRSALIALLVALPVAGAAMVDVVGRTFTAPERDAQRLLGDADARVEVTGATALTGYRPQPYPGAWNAEGKPQRDPAGVDLRALLPPGTRITADPQEHSIRLRDGERSIRASVVVADAAEPMHRHAVERLSGRLPAGPGEAMISPALAERLHAGAGARLTPADGPPVTVSGIARAPYALSSTAVFTAPGTPLARAAAASADLTGPAARSYLVDLPPGRRATALWRGLAAHGVALTPRDTVLHPERYEPATGASPVTLDSLRAGAMALLVGGIGLLEVVLLAGTAFAVGARRQTRELGLVAAGGGTARHVRRIVLAQGLTLGALGAAGESSPASRSRSPPGRCGSAWTTA